MEVYAWSVAMQDSVEDTLVCGAVATKEEAVQAVFDTIWGLDDPETLAELDNEQRELLEEQRILLTNTVGVHMPIPIDGNVVSIHMDKI